MNESLQAVIFFKIYSFYRTAFSTEKGAESGALTRYLRALTTGFSVVQVTTVL